MVWAEETSDATIPFNIPQQAADLALTEFAEQADMTLVFPDELVREKEANALIGEYTLEEGAEILLAGTGLNPEFSNKIVMSISTDDESANKGEDMNVKKKAGFAAFLAGLFSVSAGAQEPEENEEAIPLEEIIVTGTHIRGVAPVGSQLITIDRQDIDQSGFASAADIVQSLPQNFKRGANDADVTEGFNNITQGASVNLRGLGTSSTLVLLNGRRLPIAGLLANFTDISTIPTSAIERVEILPDGASAIYGSDAIGGVVNFVLRDDFEGAETVLRYGDVTDGSSPEVRFAQTFGNSWGSGNGLISYEYYERDGLPMKARPFLRSDLRPFGGDDFRLDRSNPGTIVGGNLLDGSRIRGVQIGIPSGQDGTSLTPSDLLYGVPNLSEGITGGTLAPDTKRHSVFGLISQDIGEKFSLFAEVRYSDRKATRLFGGNTTAITVPSSNAFFVDPFIPEGGSSSIIVNYHFADDLPPGIWEGEQESYSVVLGQTLDFGDEWQLEISGSYSNEDGQNLNNQTTVNSASLNPALADSDPATAFNPFGDGSFTNPATLAMLELNTRNESTSSNVKAFDLIVDGTLFAISGGDVKLAAGISYRDESYSKLSDATNDAQLDRDVTAVFGEVFFPLVNEANGRPGMERLEFSAAVRYEEYGGISSLDSTDPKIGVLWSPAKSINFRGSWGTSFKAPTLVQQDATGGVLFAFPVPSPTGSVVSIGRTGGNADLLPETATTWTAGLEYIPQSLPGFEFSATWFNIDYENRIEESPNTFGFLFDPIRFALRINDNPTPEELAVLCNDPAMLNFIGDPDCATVEVILDGRFNNTALTKVSGLDLNVAYGFDSDRMGRFDFRINGSYMQHFQNAISEADPLVEDLDTVDNPTSLRMRNSISWSNNKGMSAIAFINFVDSYIDDNSAPARKIDSWTTVDLTLAYRTESELRKIALNDTTFSLSIVNLFDEDPPFVNKNGRGYDPTNANANGRFISFNITKAW